ncbi:MAG: TetR/AcrR family transcriptional regulator [Chlorobi bacterium]|nr:TetR/AcrR family transcriptional regulator [Chlorobiota bacterium]
MTSVDKEKILEKAVELFFSQGIKETTMDALAKALHISKKTLYKHFAHKDDLVREAVRYLSDEISRKMDEIEARNLNPYEDFFAVRRMINTLVKQVNMSPYRQMQIYYPELVREMEEIKRKRIFEFLERNFDKGIRLGFYKKKLNKDFFKRIFYGCKFVLHDERIFPQDMLHNYKNNAMFIKLYLDALSTKKGKKVLKEVLKQHGL